MWYAADNNWRDAVALLQAHPGAVSSVITFCGLDLSDAGTLIPSFSPACSQLFPALAAEGVKAEVSTGGGNCSISAMRVLWADPASPPALLAYALAANASGVSVDFEPQADNCKGGATGSSADAAPFSAWLTAVRALLAPHDIRLTVDVAGWSPVLKEYATLARGVDRLLTMETYNGDSAAQWGPYLSEFLAGTPLEKAGVGLGAWGAGKDGWWETPAGAAFKVNASAAAGVPELAVFRILPAKNPPWPLPFWWEALARFREGGARP
jgi:hypothetical protein